jgi:hypothetical protein
MGQQHRANRGGGEEHEDNLQHDSPFLANQLIDVVA